MTDADRDKIHAITDDYCAAVLAEWPALADSPLWPAHARNVRLMLAERVGALREREARAEAERVAHEAFERAQAARPEHAQQSATAAGGAWRWLTAGGAWWWLTADGDWTDGIQTRDYPGPGVSWLAVIGDGTAVHRMDGRAAECGRPVGHSLTPVYATAPTCRLCLRREEVPRG